jgi:hypothetical protein
MKRSNLLLIAFAMVALLALGACIQAPPDRQLGFQAILTDPDGAPVSDGDYNITIKFWNNETESEAANLVYEDDQVVTVTDGLFNIAIPDVIAEANELNPAAFSQPLWTDITIEGETLAPRQKLLGTPYAFSLVGGALVKVSGTNVQPLIDNHPNQGAFNIANLYINDDDPGSPGTTGLVVAILDPTDSQVIRACAGGLNCANELVVFRVMGDGEVYAEGNFNAGGADFAEMIQLQGQAEPGDVLVISPDQDRAVTLSTSANSTALAGVYSTDPGFIGGGSMADQPGMIPVAITGIVPVKVTAANGPILRGDLLTTSHIPGTAMLATEPQFGSLLGRAMGELLEGEGVIEVLLVLK